MMASFGDTSSDELRDLQVKMAAVDYELSALDVKIEALKAQRAALAKQKTCLKFQEAALTAKKSEEPRYVVEEFDLSERQKREEDELSEASSIDSYSDGIIDETVGAAILDRIPVDPKPWHLVMSKAYSTVAYKIIQHLDLESFLACRLVCQDWNLMVEKNKFKWVAIQRECPELIGQAAQRGDKSLVELLISKGHNVNIDYNFQQEVDRNLLGQDHWAYLQGYKKVVVNIRNTPLHEASLEGHEEIVKMLLAAGANVNYRTNFNGRPIGEETALNCASMRGHVQIVKMLLAAGAEVNETDAIYHAIRKGHVEVVKALVSHGADVNCKRSPRGPTPLRYAMELGEVEIIRVLLENGASICM